MTANLLDSPKHGRPDGDRESGPRDRRVLCALTTQERVILELMADGLSNNGISRQLFVSRKTVEGHVGSIFMKLDLAPAPDENRRVRAVLQWISAVRDRGTS